MTAEDIIGKMHFGMKMKDYRKICAKLLENIVYTNFYDDRLQLFLPSISSKFFQVFCVAYLRLCNFSLTA